MLAATTTPTASASRPYIDRWAFDGWNQVIVEILDFDTDLIRYEVCEVDRVERRNVQVYGCSVDVGAIEHDLSGFYSSGSRVGWHVLAKLAGLK